MLSVVVFHAAPGLMRGGFVGVDVFFVISGFLITTQILTQIEQGNFSFLDFWGRRVRRLFPALILVTASTLAFGWFVLLSDELNMLGKHIVGSTAFLSNFIFASEVDYFTIDAEYKPLLHFWSLAVEEQFYIFWPILLWVCFKLNASIGIIATCILAISFLGNLIWVDRFPVHLFFLPFGRIWEILVGCVLAWVLISKKTTHVGGKKDRYLWSVPAIKYFNYIRKSGIITLTGVLILLAAAFFSYDRLPYPSTSMFFPVFGAFLILVAGGDNWAARLLLKNPLAVWIGLISYPLYLWHWPILSYLHIIFEGAAPRELRLGGVVAAVILAWVTYKFVEVPILWTSKEIRKNLLANSSVWCFGIDWFCS